MQHLYRRQGGLLLLMAVLIVLLVSVLPHWGYSRHWGYVPSGGLGFILIVLLILVLLERTIHRW
jgi:hypothetical protein